MRGLLYYYRYKIAHIYVHAHDHAQSTMKSGTDPAPPIIILSAKSELCCNSLDLIKARTELHNIHSLAA